MNTSNATIVKEFTNPTIAIDALNESRTLITFLQDVLSLQDGDQLPDLISITGFNFVMQDIKDRILAATVCLEKSIKT